MSATERSRKIDDLASWLMILRVPPGIVGAERIAEASAKATALARELFPPIAKPLTWRFDGRLHYGEFGRIDTHIIYPCLGTFFARDHASTLIKECESLDEAKAFCESHHQARFQELLA